MQDTPAELARKLALLPTAMSIADKRALAARARVTKEFILIAARSRNKGAKTKWVQYRIVGDVAAVRLRGGFAHLTEKGSYKATEGWDEGPKAATARRRTAAKKAVLTPEGPRARVHHPALRARPFWEKGIEASRVPARRAYEREVHQVITRVF